MPITRTTVGIHDGPSTLTTGFGDFTIRDVPPTIKVGFPITFYVADWIIDDPYVGERGRTYLPDPSAEPIKILARKRGDRAFLTGPSIEKMLGQRVFFFDKPPESIDSAVPVPDREGWASLANSTPAQLRVTADRSPQDFDRHRHFRSARLMFVSASEQAEQSELDWVHFLSMRAEEVGFTLAQLQTAVHEWSEHVKTDYQRGLLALYEDDYLGAANDFQQALERSKKVDAQLYISFAYTEFRLSNYAESKLFLNQLINLHPNDPMFRRNMERVTSDEKQSRLIAQATHSKNHSISGPSILIDERQAPISQTAPSDKHSTSRPSISITHVPHARKDGESRKDGEYPTEPISGDVKGINFGTHKIVIYAFAGGAWWVQPTVASPLTEDGSSGWQTITHLGSIYAVLLVKSSYKPPATTTNVPKTGGDVVAVKLFQGKP